MAACLAKKLGVDGERLEEPDHVGRALVHAGMEDDCECRVYR